MDTAFRSGLMELSMKVFGIMVRQLERASLSTLMVTFMKEIGNKTKLLATACTCITTEHAIKANGCKTTNMGMEPRLGPMEALTLDTTSKAKNMERANTYGKMEASMMDFGSKTKSQALGSIFGQMEGDIRENGLTTKCMAWESTLGETDADMKVNINLIRSMVLGHTLGLTGVSTWENG